MLTDFNDIWYMYVCMYVCMYVFTLQHENNTQNIMPEGQQGLKALTAAATKMSRSIY